MRSVFISHSSQNKVTAESVAEVFEKSGINFLLDSQELKLGSDFIHFMENALSVSNFCLLLWSEGASKSKWVTLEWESALYKTVQEMPGFLLVGRVDDFPLPNLLKPRLFVDLFPAIEPNIKQVLDIIQGDEQASINSQKIVVNPKCEQEYREGTNIYITSKLFQKTFPLRIPLNLPGSMVIEIIIKELQLPRTLKTDSPIIIQFDYSLGKGDDTPLDLNRSMSEQSIKENDVLWLQTSVNTFSGTEPINNNTGPVKYRSLTNKEEYIPGKKGFLLARESLKKRIEELGLT